MTDRAAASVGAVLETLEQHIQKTMRTKGAPDWSPHTALGVITEHYNEVIGATRQASPDALRRAYLNLANSALLAFAGVRPNEGESVQ